jgi:glutamate racemase
MFDSGIGGLTVLHECLVTMPNEDFIYVGDTGRFPYGEHTQAELVAYASELYDLLVARAVKLVVVACNSATAAALPRLQQVATLPIIGVVTPEARAAVQATRNRRIGVLATTATVTSDRYRHAIHDLDAGAEVLSIACPGLAEAIQAGEPYTDETLGLVRSATAKLRPAGVDTVILGCTHYPLVRHMIQRELGRGVVTVAAAEELAREVAETLRRKGWENDPERRGTYAFCATGDPDEFRRLGTRFLQMPLGAVEQITPSPARR